MKHIKALMALLLVMLVVANVAYALLSPPAMPSGPTSGEPGISYIYSTSDNNLSGMWWCTFNWGDGTTSAMTVKFAKIASISHTWARSGTYKVTATATDNLSVSSGESPALSVTITCPLGETDKNGQCQCPSTGQQYVNGMCTCTTPLCNGQCCGADTVCTNGKCTPCSGGRTACFGHCCPIGYACNSVTGECTKPPHGMPVQK